jgi:para-aminobenzoate synthetase component 2
MILIIDNYDSFTYNLVQVIGGMRLPREVKVIRNDAATLEELDAWEPKHLIVSPGPGTPDDGGVSMDAVRHFGGKIPVLGVCLGHQAIAQAFGAKILRADRLMHGKTSPIHHDGKGIYDGLPTPFTATRYHSLIVDEKTFPGEFEITSRTDRKELMGMRHKSMPIEGVQFHPESFLTEHGARLLGNFLNM